MLKKASWKLNLTYLLSELYNQIQWRPFGKIDNWFSIVWKICCSHEGGSNEQLTKKTPWPHFDTQKYIHLHFFSQTFIQQNGMRIRSRKTSCQKTMELGLCPKLNETSWLEANGLSVITASKDRSPTVCSCDVIFLLLVLHLTKSFWQKLLQIEMTADGRFPVETFKQQLHVID